MGSENWESVTGAPGSGDQWLTSGDFPDYGVDVVIEIIDVKRAKNVTIAGKTYKEVTAAFFPQQKGKVQKRLKLNGGHKRALRKIFGPRAEHWRGPIALYCKEDAVEIPQGRGEVEIYDAVRIRPRKPTPKQEKSSAGLSGERNVGGGPGVLGTPPSETQGESFTCRMAGCSETDLEDGWCSSHYPETLSLPE